MLLTAYLEIGNLRSMVIPMISYFRRNAFLNFKVKRNLLGGIIVLSMTGCELCYLLPHGGLSLLFSQQTLFIHLNKKNKNYN